MRRSPIAARGLRARACWRVLRRLAAVALLVALAGFLRLAASTGTAGASGIIRAADTKARCIFVGGGAWRSGLAQAERQIGVTFRCVETFTDADPTWSQWEDPWITHANSGLPGWLAAAPKRRTIVVSEDLIPQSITNNNDPLTWEQPCDTGAFDGHARQFARALVGAGMGGVVIRLGKEANGGWEQDYVGQTATEQRAWGRCFAAEVTAMRSVRGAHFLFDWNPNTCTNVLPLSNYYPGNAYVDIIGADVYDASCLRQLPGPSRASWRTLLDEPYGLATITQFAERRHKPMSIPEWGIVPSSPGLGDDPYYVAGIATYVRTHVVAFQSYFDSGSDGVAPLGPEIPLSLAMYRRLFG